jgi:uncharacterized membrane protein YjdF
MDQMKVIGWIATAIFTGISVFGAPSGSTYKFSFLFLSALLWVVYAFRGKLRLHPLHFALLASALSLHNLGAFGSYRRSYFGLEFDFYVHFYFGFVGGLILKRAFEYSFRWANWRLGIAVILIILGIGAIHELIEYASSLIMGPEKGMLKYMQNDPFDTQKDLLNNFLGALIALFSCFLVAKSRPKSKPTDQ